MQGVNEMIQKNDPNVQALIKKLYDEGKVEQIQKQSAKVWVFIQKVGHGNLTPAQATKYVLGDGVKHEDLMTGILDMEAIIIK